MSKIPQMVRSVLRYLLFWLLFCSGFLLGHYFQDMTRRFQRTESLKRQTRRTTSAEATANLSIHQAYQALPSLLPMQQEDAYVSGNMQSTQARGVALYLLWLRKVSHVANLPSPPPGIARYWESVGAWYTLHLVWMPDSDREPEPWLNTIDTLEAMTTLCQFAEHIAQTVVVLSATDTEPLVPVYSVLHIREIAHKGSPRAHLLPLHLWARRVSKQQETLSNRRAFMTYILRHLEVFETEREAGWSSTHFSHYDDKTKERGWIVVHPRQAFVAGVSDGQARTLIDVLQHRDIDLSKQREGIIAGAYGEVLAHIGQWNSTQDIYETVGQLENLVSSGQKSTDGQVMLNLALAAIGIFLSLAAPLQIKNDQLWWSLTLLCIASLFFWGFARFGRATWQILGFLTFFGALLFYTEIWWYTPFLRFFMFLIKGIELTFRQG